MRKRILITSISSWNQQTGSNTLPLLLQYFDPDSLAHIYISGGLPDSKICSRYFNIREWAVVKSIIFPSVKTGEEIQRIDPSVTAPIGEESNNIHSKLTFTHLRILRWAREAAWLLGRWNSRELNDFLDDFKPDVLLFPIESYPYFNRLNEHIIRKCHPRKVIGYLWDDNFTYKQLPYSIGFRIERFFLRKQVKRLVANCSDVLAISPKMKEECDTEFGIKSIVLTKPIYSDEAFVPHPVGNPIKILYTGKLIIGRDNTIIEVVRAIKKINRNGQKVILDIYSNTVLTENQRRKIEVNGCSRLHKAVPQSEVAELQKKADILLFAESLSNQNLTARLSFSTKMTDYFAAGRCIWAIGNKDLGPISYIESEDAGVVSGNIASIYSTLETIVYNRSIIMDYAQKSYYCGQRNHNYKAIINCFRKIISQDK